MLGLVVLETIRTVRFFEQVLYRFFVRGHGCAGTRFQGFFGAGARATAASTQAVHALRERLCDGPAVEPAHEQTVLNHDFARTLTALSSDRAALCAAPRSGRATLYGRAAL